MGPESGVLALDSEAKDSDSRAIDYDFPGNSSLILLKNRKHSLFNNAEGMVWSGNPLPEYPYICHHAGLILFTVLLDRVLNGSLPRSGGLLGMGKQNRYESAAENAPDEEPKFEIHVFEGKEKMMEMKKAATEFLDGSDRVFALERVDPSSPEASQITKHRIVRQWYASILMGAVNHEQSKKLCFKDLELLIGPQIKSLNHQRNLLDELANKSTTQALYRHNGWLLDVENESDFYYDPQGEEYTGQLRTLKGWCGRRGRVTKILYNDFIHCSNGWPAYTKCWDNYYDMRERFSPPSQNFEEF